MRRGFFVRHWVTRPPRRLGFHAADFRDGHPPLFGVLQPHVHQHNVAHHQIVGGFGTRISEMLLGGITPFGQRAPSSAALETRSAVHLTTRIVSRAAASRACVRFKHGGFVGWLRGPRSFSACVVVVNN